MDQASAQQPETQQVEQSRPSHLHGLYWAIVVLPVLYVLSFGPAVKLDDAGVISDSVLVTIYTPLLIITNHCEPFGKFMLWYIQTVWRCKLD